MHEQDTIVAQATASGKGGVAIVRISGPKAIEVAKKVLGKVPTPRYAEHCAFHDDQGDIIDEGIALYFKAPRSFTGEDVLELQGHGGPVIIDMLIQSILHIDQLRLAKPGEFRSNVHLGGSVLNYEMTDEEKESAVRSAKVLGLQVAGVDLIQSDRGPLVLEVNSSPGLEGIERASEIDVAEKIIEFLEYEIQNRDLSKPIDI